MGSPKTTSTAATSTANRIVSQNACQSIRRHHSAINTGQYSQSQAREVPMWANSMRNVHSSQEPDLQAKYDDRRGGRNGNSGSDTSDSRAGRRSEPGNP